MKLFLLILGVQYMVIGLIKDWNEFFIVGAIFISTSTICHEIQKLKTKQTTT